MGHTYTNLLVHCVFSTLNREPLLRRDVRDRVWQFIGGIARENNMHALQVGGYTDHVHVLLSIRANQTVSKAMQEIKSGSSSFIHQQWRDLRGFAWQEGYGAFSVSESSREDVVQYIANQEEHHKTKTFQEEYVAFLKKNAIEYDERYVWG